MPPRRSAWREWGRHLLLFVLTFASVFVTQGLLDDGSTLRLDLRAGFEMAVGLMSILLAHEMGHYVAARRYGVDATLPFFIPAPIINPLAGTFGAVIRIRSPFPNRKALFDIGIAGPLAGFVVAVPILVLGIMQARIIAAPTHSAPGDFLGEPLLFALFAGLLKTVPDGMTLALGPLGMAAWFGLLVTGLNLIPVGQLDGGHVTYALFGRRATVISRIVWWMCVASIVLVGPAWILWTVLVRVLGLTHPPTLDDETPLGTVRTLVAVVGLAVFVLSFLPNPMLVTWRDIFDLFTRRS